MGNRNLVPAAERRTAHTEKMRRRALTAVPSTVPHGYALSPVDPLSFPLGAKALRLTWDDLSATVAQNGAPVDPVGGVVLFCTAYTSAMRSGKSWPAVSNLASWRPTAIRMQKGDTLELASFKQGTAMVYPFTGREPERATADALVQGDDGCSAGDPFEGLPMPGKLGQMPRWHT